jgi:hypothetical protein
MSYLLKKQKQQGGTCWFHSSLNGFLQSIYGRTFLKKVISEEGNIKNTNINYCPTKTANRSVLLSLVKLYLKEGIVRENKSVLQRFTGNNLKHEESGGTVGDQERIYKLLFTPDQQKLIRLIKEKTGNIEKTNGNWTLSHAYIRIVFSDGSKHAITGGIDPGHKFFVYDSNGARFDCDWNTTSGQQQLMEFLSSLYKRHVDGITVNPTWINTNMVTNKNINNTITNIQRNVMPKNVKQREIVKQELRETFPNFIKNKSDILKFINMLYTKFPTQDGARKTLKLQNYNKQNWEVDFRKLVSEIKQIKQIMNLRYNYVYEGAGGLNQLKRYNQSAISTINKILSDQNKSIRKPVRLPPIKPKTPLTPNRPKIPNRPETPNRPKTPLTPNRPETPLTSNRPKTPLTPNRPSRKKEMNERVEKARERSNRLRQTTSKNKAFIKPKNNSQSRSIYAGIAKGNMAYGAIRSQLSNKLRNSRLKMRANRNRGQIFSHDPMLVLNTKISPSTPRPRRLEPINNLRSENIIRQYNGLTNDQILKLNNPIKRKILSHSSIIIGKRQSGNDVSTNNSRIANRITSLLWNF